jgi:hypothetical protein
MTGRDLAYQDGASFYTVATGSEIVTYHNSVRNDADMFGAQNARRLFIEEYGDRYTLEGAQ